MGVLPSAGTVEVLETLVDGAPFVAIDYDPTDKGNDMVVTYGDEQEPSGHVISGPVALWQAQDENGLVVSVEIEAEGGTKTIVVLA
jgi:hypothetical protein